MSLVQDRHIVLNALMMACWQRPDRRPVILHSDPVTQFTSADYQHCHRDRHTISSMSAVRHCGDNAAMGGFFGVLKRQRVHLRRYLTSARAKKRCP